MTKEIFNNPYVVLGHDEDICVLCKQEKIKENPQLAREYPWMIDEKLKKQLANKKIFKIFQNTNTPFVICKEHLEKILDEMQESKE